MMKILAVLLLLPLAISPPIAGKRRALFEDGPLDGKRAKVAIEVNRIGQDGAFFYAPTGGDPRPRRRGRGRRGEGDVKEKRIEEIAAKLRKKIVGNFEWSYDEEIQQEIVSALTRAISEAVEEERAKFSCPSCGEWRSIMRAVEKVVNMCPAEITSDTQPRTG